MTSPELSPELAALLHSSRPAASPELRARIREIATADAVKAQPLLSRLRLPSRRVALVVLPATAALAIASAGVLGIARSDTPSRVAVDQQGAAEKDGLESVYGTEASPAVPLQGAADATRSTAPGALAPDTTRKQRIEATMTLEVPNSDGVAGSAQKAIALTQRLGGHVVGSNVITGEGANAQLTLRRAGRTGPGGGRWAVGARDDRLAAGLDAGPPGRSRPARAAERSVRAQIALLVARLESDSLEPGQRAIFEARLKNLRNELRALRLGIAGTNAEARMATIQMTVVTADGSGVVPVPSRLDRTLDEALNVLVWEGVVALAILIVAAPFALVAFAIWLGNRLYRRREDDRLLTAN